MERDYYPGILRGALYEGWPLYRIADGPTGRKPFDFGGASHTGRAVGLEVKLVRCLNRNEPIPWNIFEVHQRGWLEQYAKSGALALAAFYEKDLERMVVIRLATGHFDDAVGSLDRWVMKKIEANKQQAFLGWRKIDG